MKKGDTQLGTPQVLYTGTTAAIEALTGVPEGATAYSTDDNMPGWYDGAAWVWGAGGASALDDLTDVNAPAPGDGQALVWDAGGGEWIAADVAGGTIDASAVTFTPLDDSHWAGTLDPGNTDDALDQLASRLADLEASLTMMRQTIFTVAGNITLGGGVLRIDNALGVTETISKVLLRITTAPTGADLIVDIHKDGVTIFTDQNHRPRIAAGAYTGFTTDIDVSAWADGSYLTCEIDQIGSTITGANLVVSVLHR